MMKIFRCCAPKQTQQSSAPSSSSRSQSKAKKAAPTTSEGSGSGSVSRASGYEAGSASASRDRSGSSSSLEINDEGIMIGKKIKRENPHTKLRVDKTAPLTRREQARLRAYGDTLQSTLGTTMNTQRTEQEDS